MKILMWVFIEIGILVVSFLVIKGLYLVVFLRYGVRLDDFVFFCLGF